MSKLKFSFPGICSFSLCFFAALICDVASGATLNFQLLTWDDANATPELPSATGRKPSATMPVLGDWLVFTADDAASGAANNPAGALSHNFVDVTGAGGAGFNLAASLSGALTLNLESSGGADWAATVTSLDFAGQANAMQAMNQLLITSGSPATTNSAFKVDGMGNTGQWTASATNHWRLQFTLDFYFASSSDGNPSPSDIDATFNDKTQTGFLIPVNQLTTSGLADVELDDPVGFHTGNFEQYLLEQIAPRLPSDATYLLITQMAKTQPGYVEIGLPITTASLIGTTVIGYTTQSLAAAPQLTSVRFENDKPVIRFTHNAGQVCSIQRSENLKDWKTVAHPVLISPEAGFAEWTDVNAAVEQQFYRIIAITP